MKLLACDSHMHLKHHCLTTRVTRGNIASQPLPLEYKTTRPIFLMAAPFPYAHYACPCSSSSGFISSKRASQPEPEDQDTFNPHDPRAAYALYPLDHLLFCDECSQIRCQKCVNDEIITWFCPSCLFDVPSGQVRGEHNR
jgi:hypothetical protein